MWPQNRGERLSPSQLASAVASATLEESIAPFQLFYRNPYSGARHEIPNARAASSVTTIKCIVAQQMNLFECGTTEPDPAMVRLLHNGRHLDDVKTLSAHGIESGTTLEMCLRLRGD